MQTHIRNLAFLLPCLILAAKVNSAPLPSRWAARSRIDTIRIERNVEYGKINDVSLKLDLYIPAGDMRVGSHPGVVFIHGGGWVGGDKASWEPQARDLAERGFVAASINYRLAPKYRYPAAVEDCELAIRWLRQRSGEFHLDPARIGAIGDSAGGHLAALMGLRSLDESKESSLPYSSRVQCVVDYYGRTDLTIEQPAAKGFHDYRSAFIGKKRSEALSLYREASPLYRVDSTAAPFLILQGNKDVQVIPLNSQRMLEALEKAHVDATLVLIANEGHGFSSQTARTVWEFAVLFLERHLSK